MNIADWSGRGEDHCELVGGSELSASTVVSYLYPSVKGINYPLFSILSFVKLMLTLHCILGYGEIIGKCLC